VPGIDPLQSVIPALMRLVGAIVAFTMHEWAHAMTAYRLGDFTQREQGRLSLNPMRHLHWQGLLLVAVFGFGWARPVRLSPELLRNRRRDTVLVSLAGSAINLLMCPILLALVRISVIGMPEAAWLHEVLLTVYIVTLSIGVFNLLPLPPLDGFRALSAITGWEESPNYGRILQIGSIITLVCMVTPAASYVVTPVMEGITQALLRALAAVGL